MLVFLKPLEDLKFEDIERLKSNKICESEILDYKEQLLKDDELLKHVSAFANTQGGFLIFGVKETGRGGYPKEISSVDKSLVNKERIEQVILSNVQPRLNVKLQLIDHQDQSKVIIVIQIPDSYLKPHMKRQGDRFYKRHNFEALPMTELEVNDAYKTRFASYQEVESYISKLLETKGIPSTHIIGQIVVTPTVLRRMIDTSDIQKFDWIEHLTALNFNPSYLYIPSIISPSPNGVKSQYLAADGHARRSLEIHRNGCVYYKDEYGEMGKERMIFHPLALSGGIMCTLQFASMVYQRYNFFGELKIICDLRPLRNSWVDSYRRFVIDYSPCQTNEITISREYPTNIVESKYELVTSGIMDEIFNSYGLWKCPFFDEKGNFITDSARY